MIKDNCLNTDWIKICFSDDGARVRNQELICTGTIYGPPHLFITFAELVLASWSLLKCRWDHPIVNYLISTGELAKAASKRSQCIVIGLCLHFQTAMEASNL
jgi:hypothetical protein